MITSHFSELLRGVQQIWKGTDTLPSTADYPILRDLLSLSLAEIWTTEFWPELLLIEKRYFRPSWVSGYAGGYAATTELWDAVSQGYYQSLRAANTQAPTIAGVENSAYWAACKTSYSAANWATGTTYAVGDIVYYTGTEQYYQCHTAHTAGAWATTNWGRLTRFIRSIDFDQTGQSTIGDVSDLYDDDPRVTWQYESLAYLRHESSVIVRDAVTSAWVRFSQRCPMLTGAVYDTTAGYAVGAQVYYESAGVGDLYDCVATASAGDTPATDPEKWTIVSLPRRFRGYLIWAALAKLPKLESERQAWAQAQAESYLNLEKARLTDPTHQRVRPAIATY